MRLRAAMLRRQSRQAGYMAAVVGLGLATIARWGLSPFLDDRPFVILYIPIVLAAAGLGGWAPAIFATAGSLAVILVSSHDMSWTAPAYVLNVGGFTVMGPLIALAGEQLWRRSREAESRQIHLQSVLDTVPEAMIVIDAQGVIHSFSAAAERLFGLPAEQAVGNELALLMPEPYRSDHPKYIQRYLETGERRIIGAGRIVVGRRKDGSTFPMELVVGEACIGDSRFFTGFVRDLTERRARERRMQELQAELVHVSRLGAMGDMASALAHELNQPLAAVCTYIDGASALLDRPAPDIPMLRTALGEARAQALRAGEIIRHLRSFVAKGESERTYADPSRLMEEACALALVGARDRDIHVDLRLGRRLGRVLVDKVQIQQVVVNLVRNAFEAMDGSGRRDLGISVASSGSTAVRIDVSDSGPGIPKEMRERLFEPFATTKADGLGVGLSICRTIVEAHGGRLWAEDAPGGGTVFAFTLPRIAGSA